MQRDGGPGAGGNPTGGSFTGTAQALEIIGDHAYAYSDSGPLTVGEGEVTKLLFTTGPSYYFLGSLNAFTSDASTHSYVLRLYLNDGEIIEFTVNNIASTQNQDMNPIPIIIPASTEVKVTMVVTGANVDSASAQLVGRIYR